MKRIFDALTLILDVRPVVLHYFMSNGSMQGNHWWLLMLKMSVPGITSQNYSPAHHRAKINHVYVHACTAHTYTVVDV